MPGTNKELVFQFDGASVNSEAFGRDFIPLLANVYALVQACSDEEVRVVSIENNCIKVVVAAAMLASFALGASAVQGVREPAKYNVAAKALNASLKKHNATLELSDSGTGAVCRFDADRGMPAAPEPHRDVKTTLAIYGELLDVGGINPNVHIQSDAFQDDVVLDVGREDARKLAQRLYSPIGVNASVTIRDGHVISGKVLDVIDYAPQDLEDWLEQNQDTIGIEAFKGLDLATFIAEQRI